MKYKKILLIFLTILIITSSFTLTFTYARRNRPRTIQKDLQITATGTAYDKDARQRVQVTITLQGTARTHGNTWKLRIKGGTITVDGHQIIFAYKGQGTLIPKHHYLTLNIYSKSQYGDKKTVWTLKGKACEIHKDQYRIKLDDKKVYLPERHCPTLYNLNLDGKLTLN